MAPAKDLMEKIVNLSKGRGFVFPGSEIYGGLANTWDYGPLGVELKNNVKKAFWEFFVHGRNDMVGLDSAILMNPKTWEASGHISSFSDPLMDCKACKARVRADKLVESFGDERPENWCGEKTPSKDMLAFVMEKKIPCPECKACNWTEPKQFNLMFKTHQGVIEDTGTAVYLRPETAQGIFVNFKNVQRTTRKKLPFGIAQIGKSFRNEITPGNFTFRTREFEQMEIEYFFDPEETPWEGVFADFKAASLHFVEKILGIRAENLLLRDHDPKELSHYSKGTTDIEYHFPFGWGELCAAGAYRTNYDLSQHQKFSGESMEYQHDDGRKMVPHVMEPSFGADRLTLAVLMDAYHEEVLEDGDTRVVLKFAPKIAPIKVAILPLMKKDGLAEKADAVAKSLRFLGNIEVDISGSIGKRYRRQDEVGTPFCVTIDYETLEDQSVTIRKRDSMKQKRILLEDLPLYLHQKIYGEIEGE
ncbi:MAG: glycine--tRNA ligase [Candidatus Peregrinibacteria bacterium]